MPRRPRQLTPHGWYHVVNRGVAKRSIFQDNSDRRRFMRLVRDQVLLGRLRVHAFALMSNHYHLLVSTPHGELDLAFRDIARDYTRYFNDRHERDGPLFKSRYRSRRLRTRKYRENTLDYIHRNPVAAGLVEVSGDYPFCSAYYFSRGRGPAWLSRQWVASIMEERTGVADLGEGAFSSPTNPAFDQSLFDWEEEALVGANFSEEHPLDRVWNAPEELEGFVQQWIQRGVEGSRHPSHSTALVRGHEVIGALEASKNNVAAALAPMPRPDRHPSNHEVLLAGLLRDVSSLSLADSDKLLPIGVSKLQRRRITHDELWISNAKYRHLVVTIAARSINGQF